MALNFLFRRDKQKLPTDWVQTSLIPDDTKETLSPKPGHKKGDSSTTYGTTSLSEDESLCDSESSWTLSDDDSSVGSELISTQRTEREEKPESDCTAFDFLRYSPSEDEDVDLESPLEPPKTTEVISLGSDLDCKTPTPKSQVTISMGAQLDLKIPTQGSDFRSSWQTQKTTIDQFLQSEPRLTNDKETHQRSQSLVESIIAEDMCRHRRAQSMNQAQPVGRKLSMKLDTIEVNEYVRERAISDNNITGRYLEKAPVRRRHSYNVPPNQKPNDLEALQKELNLRQHMFGAQHPKVGEVYNLIGNIHFRCRRYEQAIEMYEKVLSCESGVGEVSDYLPIADALGNLGTVYRIMSELDTAIEKMELSLNAHIFVEQAQGNDPEKSMPIASILYNIGLTETLRKNYRKALHKLTQCRDIKESVLGQHHLEVASTIDAIGKAHLGLGNTEEAMTCHLRALEMKKNYSPSLQISASCVVSLKNIAAVYVKRMDYNAAILKCKEAARVQQSEHARLKMKLGCGKPDVIRLAMETGDTLLVLKELYMLEEDNKKAIRYGKEARMYFLEAGLKDDDERMITCMTRSPGVWNSI